MTLEELKKELAGLSHTEATIKLRRDEIEETRKYLPWIKEHRETFEHAKGYIALEEKGIERITAKYKEYKALFDQLPHPQGDIMANRYLEGRTWVG